MKISFSPVRIVTSAFAIATLLTACGQRGPLYLPPPPETLHAVAKPATASSPDTPEKNSSPSK